MLHTMVIQCRPWDIYGKCSHCYQSLKPQVSCSTTKHKSYIPTCSNKLKNKTLTNVKKKKKHCNGNVEAGKEVLYVISPSPSKCASLCVDAINFLRMYRNWKPQTHETKYHILKNYIQTERCGYFKSKVRKGLLYCCCWCPLVPLSETIASKTKNIWMTNGNPPLSMNMISTVICRTGSYESDKLLQKWQNLAMIHT
jgi:hypothetical protein